jgi:protein-disulfide isomerase
MRRLRILMSAVILSAPAALAEVSPAPAPVTPSTPAPSEEPPPEEATKTAPTPAEMDAALAPKPSDIGIGDPNAKVKWVEYASSGCPHCAHLSLEVIPTLKTEYMDTGKVYYVLRDFPLDGVAAAASLIARCLPKEKFYPFMEMLFAEQDKWHSPEVKDLKGAILAMAAKGGLSAEQAEACLKDQPKFDEMKAILSEAETVLGVASTPTNFVDGKKIEGAAPVEDFRKLFDEALAK